MRYLQIFVLLVTIVSCNPARRQAASALYNEPHRPLIHFTPQANWMNDPNGMVFLNGKYHLFYQYYPDSTVWGPMHWGHATSTDLVHWKHEPVALYPDSLGYIFSGSAVVDINNTSGFGKNGKPPLVAIFTHHDPVGEKAGLSTYENQSLAYSLDEGATWTKYDANPVLKNPGIRDFRDPKVRWYEEGKKWIMTLATLDRITFYSSPDLKTWTKESEFGKAVGAHGGVWECPDLFPLTYNGKKIWVLIININPGGPNGGSATQYFTGNFDGKTFVPFQTDTRWIDYGPDEYAGVTWSNTGDRTLFIGWMSNWQYANVVPTEKWRSATTVARELAIRQVGDRYLVASGPVRELATLNKNSLTLTDVSGEGNDLTGKLGGLKGPARLHLTADRLESFSITLSNNEGEKLIAGYDKTSNNYYIDRTGSGFTDFEKGFARRHTAPRLTNATGIDVTLIIDNASLELFADEGLSVMTSIFFPRSVYRNVSMELSGGLVMRKVEFSHMNSIWNMQ